MTKIKILQYNDGFGIRIEDDLGNDYHFGFVQEDSVKNLVNVFKALGFESVSFEEVV